MQVKLQMVFVKPKGGSLYQYDIFLQDSFIAFSDYFTFSFICSAIPVLFGRFLGSEHYHSPSLLAFM